MVKVTGDAGSSLHDKSSVFVLRDLMRIFLSQGKAKKNAHTMLIQCASSAKPSQVGRIK